jgi:hypothetical protein
MTTTESGTVLLTGFAVSDVLNTKLVERGRDKIPSQQIYNYISNGRIPIVDEDGEELAFADVKKAKAAGVKLKYFVTVDAAKVFIKNYLSGNSGSNESSKAALMAMFDEEPTEADAEPDAELDDDVVE